MGGEQLTIVLGFAESLHDIFEDESIVEIVLGLIDDEWPLTLCEEDQEDTTYI